MFCLLAAIGGRATWGGPRSWSAAVGRGSYRVQPYREYTCTPSKRGQFNCTRVLVVITSWRGPASYRAHHLPMESSRRECLTPLPETASDVSSTTATVLSFSVLTVRPLSRRTGPYGTMLPVIQQLQSRRLLAPMAQRTIHRRTVYVRRCCCCPPRHRGRRCGVVEGLDWPVSRPVSPPERERVTGPPRW